MGKNVQTVRGAISPADAGITLMHEHLFSKFGWLRNDGSDKSSMKHSTLTVNLRNFSALRKDPSSSIENITPNTRGVIINELRRFVEFGGKTIVDVTPIGSVGRDPEGMKEISSRSGVNIVGATGWYTSPTYPSYIEKSGVDELSEILVDELSRGIDDTGIRCGVIGEVGCSDPPTPSEHRIFQAVGRAQRQTGAPCTTHPSLPIRNGLLDELRSSHWYIDVLEREGADLSKLYVGHADRTCTDIGYQEKLLARGVTLAYDTFGHDHFITTPYSRIGGRCDGERIDGIVELCKLGYDKQIVLSQDICFKTDLKSFGGFGYSHVVENIVPRLRFRGVSQKQIHRMLVDNPRRLLST